MTLHSVSLQSARAEEFPHPPPEIRVLLDAIGTLDPDLGTIEGAAGPLPWRVRPAGFAGLLHAIVAQQISIHAASAIWGRLLAVEGAMEPLGLLAISDEVFRSVGFSRPKVGHARALATAFLDGVLSADALETMADDDAVRAIASVRGMGPWSAEVYLLFGHGRPDIFPAGDIALAASVAHLKGLTSRPTPLALRRMSEAWRPYRGLAARLLFHHWRHVTGRPPIDA